MEITIGFMVRAPFPPPPAPRAQQNGRAGALSNEGTYLRIDLNKLMIYIAPMDPFHALADPTRRAIMTLLADGERSAGAIGAEFPISGPAVSQHLKVLREAGLVTARVEAQRRIYRLNRAGLAEVEQWLAGVRVFWKNRLDALEASLDRDARNELGDGEDG